MASEMKRIQEFNLNRLLMGPGPCNPAKEVMDACSISLVGHLDAVFFQVMDAVCDGLRKLYQTKNVVTFPASGTGTSGMELLASNLVEEGDTVVVGVAGYFAARLVEMCRKLKAKVIPVEVPYGQGITPQMIEDAIKTNGGKVDFVWVVMAETSTGYLNTSLKELSQITHKYGGLFMIDCVTGLGCCDLKIDEWEIDAAFSGTQKALSVPPSMSPITISERAMQKFRARKTPVPTFYFDLEKLISYWIGKDGKKMYHHTVPINSVYALYEGLRLLHNETMPVVQQRYKESSTALRDALEKRGFTYAVTDAPNRLPNLHCVYPPEGVDEAKLRSNLWEQGIEIGAGLGLFAGKAVRIGLMGANANLNTVQKFLSVLDQVLQKSQKSSL
eukprot:TRINITY_DN7618_c0_g1_i1.p1 TRINITY_DN7618_c0_g1~~TRINITY_DN7618_c0_g1_i1.p1  ORF type:complete len:411 (+),score=50.76 TRINITY_DN7618_c0_g1_i1:73-1233(+)